MDETSGVAPSVGQLSIEEKAALCGGATVWDTVGLPDHGLESIAFSDGPHGLRYQPVVSGALGVADSAPATCFPTACALGSSWSPELVHEVGSALGVESAASGVAVLLGPGVNIKRSPLGGRNFEYFSEDPFLAGRMGAAWVHGIQSQHVGAAVKHFAVNNQETDRLRIDVDVDERTLREIYLPAFEHIVRTARPWTVMSAYNRINGTHASEHRWLLTELLRKEWGFDGLVVSDWGAVHNRVRALQAGLDLEMPPNVGISDRAIQSAVRDGSLQSDVVDETARRLVRLVRRSAARAPAKELSGATLAEHHALARRAAADGMVLLKNEGRVLPLCDRPGLGITVIGRTAIEPRYQGAGSSQVKAVRVDEPLDALCAALPSARVRHVNTFGDIEDAVDSAHRSDVVVAFLGMPPDSESEGFDRTDIDLPIEQTTLLTTLAQRVPDTPLVAVLCQGSAVRMHPWEGAVAATLQCWLAGQAMGLAIADVITGTAEPGGRLAETVPLRIQDIPSYLGFPGGEGVVRYGEGVFVGYRGYDAVDTEVAYPFGHGLSYTSFDYSEISLTLDGCVDDGELNITVSATVTNVGPRPGADVPQLYVGPPPDTAVRRPVRELAGFQKVRLDVGESERVTFTLGTRELAYWSVEHHRWVVEPGPIDLWIGASSRDLRLHTMVTIEATRPPTPLTSTSTLKEWLADPDGHAALLAAVGYDADGRPRGVLGDAELTQMIATVPLETLALFPGVGFTTETVRQLID